MAAVNTGADSSKLKWKYLEFKLWRRTQKIAKATSQQKVRIGQVCHHWLTVIGCVKVFIGSISHGKHVFILRVAWLAVEWERESEKKDL